MKVTLVCALGVILTLTISMLMMNTILQTYGKGGITWKIFKEKKPYLQ